MLRMVAAPKSIRKLAFFTTTMTNQISSTANAFENPMTPLKNLERARALELPSYPEMLRRDAKVYDFWNHNDETLEKAWEEWNKNDEEASALPKLDASILNPKLREAVEAARKQPTRAHEQAIKDLWEEVAPGIFSVQFFDLNQLYKLRQWFDTTAESGIPTRPPYGISLNRRGVMIDPRSVGYLAAPDFQDFYRFLIDYYIRPLGRLFYPESIRETDDTETFSFSIQYQGEQGGDKSLRHHTDASTLTFNINLDSTKTWTGSSLVFIDESRQGSTQVTWSPGIAIMHLGKSMHAALPIESGTRSNWVIWTMGRDGGQGYGNPLISADTGCYPEEYHMTAEQRWTIPESRGPVKHWNRWSPF